MTVDKKTSKTMMWIFVISLILGAFMVFLVVAGKATQLNEQEVLELQRQRAEQGREETEAERAGLPPRSPEATGEKLQPSAELPEEHEVSD